MSRGRRCIWRRRAILASAAGTMFCYASGPANAVIRRDDVSDSLYIALGNDSKYAAVGVVHESTGFGGGILISPKWVFSAGHVVAATPSVFRYGNTDITNGSTVGVSQYFEAPGYNGDASNGTDVGLIQLSGIPTGITPATRYFGPSEIGKLGTFIGYGETGTGLTGHQSNTEGTKRGFTNMMDIDGSNANFGWSNKLVGADFDDPGNLDGKNLPGGGTVPTALEGVVHFFDSGGGVFVDINNRTYVSATHNAIFAYPTNVNPSIGDGNPDGSYSDITFSTRTVGWNSWIDDSIDNNWTAAGNGNFATASNWAVGTMTSGTPGAGDIAGFNTAGNHTVTFTGAVSNHQLLARQGSTTLNLAGFTYNLTSTMYEGGVVVGRYDTSNATVTFASTSGAGTVNSNDAVIAQLASSTGQVVVGSNATWNVTGDMYVGGSYDGIGGNGTLTLISSTSSLSISGTLRVYGSGTVAYNAGSLSVGTLDVAGGRVNLSVGANKLLRTKAVTISVASGGKIDLTDNDMIINYDAGSPLSTIQSYITTGYNNGNWNGNGIVSSRAITSPNGGEIGKTALGYGEAGTLNITSFDGVGVDSTTVLVKYTYRGDANLDGNVDMTDLYLLSQHWLTSGNIWTGGDFNYDGTVNAKDLGLLALNWQSGTSATLGEPLDLALGLFGLPLSAVPEPAGLSILMLALYPLKRARRRSR